MGLEALASSLRQQIIGEVLLKEQMDRHTTWHIGGPADLLVIPKTEAEVETAVTAANKANLPLTIIGKGSNVLVLDGGVRGLVLKIGSNLSQVEITGPVISAQAGAFLPQLVGLAHRKRLSGLEFAAGIPGTIGGATVMNAGAHGRSLGELVQQVRTYDRNGKVRQWRQDELRFNYRHSALQQGDWIVTAVTFRLRPQEAVERGPAGDLIREKMALRRASQPLDRPNAGSVFRNPEGVAAGYLIEQAGAKGMRKGGAQVSQKHANFIINNGGATARDVLELIQAVQELVYVKHGIKLEPEIKILGEHRS